MDGLSAAGIDPAAVTDVIFTHGHPDHLWGILDDLDELVFPNAAYRMGKAEWNFWRDPATVEAMPEERKTFAVGAQTRLAAIEEKITLFGAGEEVIPGVEAVDTAGHTPGHMSFMVHGGSEKVFIVGDAISHAVISFQKPDWHSGSDQDPERGAKTRTALLDRLGDGKAAHRWLSPAASRHWPGRAQGHRLHFRCRRLGRRLFGGRSIPALKHGEARSFQQVTKPHAGAEDDRGHHDGRRDRQHRDRRDALADGTAHGDDAAHAHEGRARDVARQFAGIVAGFPAHIAAHEGGGRGPGDDAQHETHAIIRQNARIGDDLHDRIRHRHDEGSSLDLHR